MTSRKPNNSDLTDMHNPHHHVTPGLAVGCKSTVVPFRAPLPTATVYHLEKLAPQPCEVAPKAPAIVPAIAPEPVAEKRRGSMFFKGNTDKMDKDPFLQRLARLN